MNVLYDAIPTLEQLHDIEGALLAETFELSTLARCCPDPQERALYGTLESGVNAALELVNETRETYYPTREVSRPMPAQRSHAQIVADAQRAIARAQAMIVSLAVTA